MKDKKYYIFFLLLGLTIISSALQFTFDHALLAWFLVGMISLILGLSVRKASKVRLLLCLVGIFLLLFTLLSTIGMWIALLLVVGYLFRFGKDFFQKIYLPKKAARYHSISIQPSGSKQAQKHVWFGRQFIGEEVYEWDDINLISFGGDTIVDLGNTILPTELSVVCIRKLYGDVRLIVPAGVEVELHHSGLTGRVIFQHQEHEISNETILLYSSKYTEANKKIKCMTSILVGNVEVIEG